MNWSPGTFPLDRAIPAGTPRTVAVRAVAIATMILIFRDWMKSEGMCLYHSKEKSVGGKESIEDLENEERSTKMMGAKIKMKMLTMNKTKIARTS